MDNEMLLALLAVSYITIHRMDDVLSKWEKIVKDREKNHNFFFCFLNNYLGYDLLQKK